MVRLAWSNAAPSRPKHCLLGAPSARTDTDHCGVDGQLSAMEKWEPVCHHFQATVVHPWHWWEVQILYPDVLGDSSTCFSADSGSATLQWKPTATQDPCVSTSSPVMATRVKWLATPASCRRQGKRAPKATKEQHPKTLRVKTSCKRHWRSEERDAGHGTSLRSCQSLVSVPQRGRDRSVEERFLHWC